MAADYYYADTENGDHIDDPSEDALFMLIDELNRADNTFVTINPADDDPAWYASISLLDDDTYEVERRDTHQHIHDLTIETDPGHIARDLTIWLAGRHYPNRPA
ncbi:hypothetical protein DER29_3423 [Micromonospora sp. M71_S20]|uniref:hypothetical protein n=2 Tax=unclassified Micromonospora TaxID=2617518 RepID=UPI000EAE0B2F|nr:hypothetical protein [Micromonospora sp. M71_S20]RLK09566.1 hypothetical protein DER29_6094 [Micromonospora sp. M71_S20]RLK25418.1 hypothetical protein DER29_3423 [Micromonospora sp. M71_S20]